MKTLLMLILALQSLSAAQLMLVAGGGTATNQVPALAARLTMPFGVDFNEHGEMFMCSSVAGMP